MFDAKFFEDVAKRLSEAVPTSVMSVKEDLEKNFHAILQSAFNKMDLVTREEFDVQVKLLARTREKLELLQSQLAEMEARQQGSEEGSGSSTSGGNAYTDESHHNVAGSIGEQQTQQQQ